MVIVGGWFEVEPGDRDAFVAGRADSVRRSRGEDGCLEYVIAPDPVEESRVVLFERWTSQAALDAHLAAARSTPSSRDEPASPAVAPKSVSIVVYDVSGERPLT
jgi:quinol monooxygenase YgiN